MQTDGKYYIISNVTLYVNYEYIHVLQSINSIASI